MRRRSTAPGERARTLYGFLTAHARVHAPDAVDTRFVPAGAAFLRLALAEGAGRALAGVRLVHDDPTDPWGYEGPGALGADDVEALVAALERWGRGARDPTEALRHLADGWRLREALGERRRIVAGAPGAAGTRWSEFAQQASDETQWAVRLDWFAEALYAVASVAWGPLAWRNPIPTVGSLKEPEGILRAGRLVEALLVSLGESSAAAQARVLDVAMRAFAAGTPARAHDALTRYLRNRRPPRRS